MAAPVMRGGDQSEFRPQSSQTPGGGEAVDVLSVHNVMASAYMGAPVDLAAANKCLGNSVLNTLELGALRVDVRCKGGGVASLSIFA